MKRVLLIAPPEVSGTARLVEEFRNLGAEVVAVSAAEAAGRNFDFDPARFDVLYVRFAYPFLRQTVELARRFREAGRRIVDRSVADGRLALGKADMHECLTVAGLPTPRTVPLARAGTARERYPYVVKWVYGMKGREVFLIRTERDTGRPLALYGEDELLWQEYLEPVSEYKVFTVGYRALPKALRYEPDPKGFRLNFGSGTAVGTALVPGLFGLAERAAEACGAELSKVDVLETTQGLFILEVNHAPGFKNYELSTGENLASQFARYVLA